MRILLDECVPQRLRTEFAEHDVRTVTEMGWSGVKNGVLLQLLQVNGFELFLTVDQNLSYQQNLQGTTTAILVLAAPSNRLADLLPLVPAAKLAISTIKPGQVVQVT